MNRLLCSECLVEVQASRVGPGLARRPHAMHLSGRRPGEAVRVRTDGALWHIIHITSPSQSASSQALEHHTPTLQQLKLI